MEILYFFRTDIKIRRKEREKITRKRWGFGSNLRLLPSSFLMFFFFFSLLKLIEINYSHKEAGRRKMAFRIFKSSLVRSKIFTIQCLWLLLDKNLFLLRSNRARMARMSFFLLFFLIFSCFITDATEDFLTGKLLKLD